MRTLSICALVLLGIVALWAIPQATATCSPGDINCENPIGAVYGLLLVGFLGSVLVLIALIWGIVTAIRRGQ